MTGAEFDGRGEVDIDLLADYIGGALAGTSDESAVATLIDEDPAWREAYAELADGMAAVGAELARFEPEAMPADVAARLDALLATQGRAEIAEPGHPVRLTVVRDPDSVGDGAPGVPHKTTQRKRGRMRWATPIAIAAGVVAFAGFGLDYLAGRSSTDKAASTGLAPLQGREDSGRAAFDTGGMRILSSGIDYTQATLTAPPEAAQPLAASGSQSSKLSTRDAPQVAVGSGADPLARLRDQAQLQACLGEIEKENAGGVIAVQTVDYARFNGAPAVVVRFSAADGIWAWASGPACGTPSGGADTLSSAPVR